jgi:SulP family sulfate permease
LQVKQFDRVWIQSAMAVATAEPLNNDERRQDESLISVASRKAVSYATEFSAGLTVSFVAMSLGAAFGVASKRGPLPGILSAGFIALITAILGGTKVQCSGPTAPMTAVTVVLVTAVMETGIVDGDCGVGTDDPAVKDCKNRFINMTIIVMACCLLLCALCRVGALVKFVPNIVISGFMNGIAVLIWWGEANKVFGFNKEAYSGGLVLNFFVMIFTTAICLGLPIVLGKVGIPILKKLLPSTLVAIVVMTAVCLAFDDIKRVDVGEPISSFSDVSSLFSRNVPTTWSGPWLLKAIPFALNLTMLCYLDTLLTSLVMDQKVDEKYDEEDRWAKTNQNKELFAQGIANAFIALFGGLPGAQATIRSVLILNEGARTRVAGVCVGLFAIIEMVALQNLVGLIPAAVFSGVLLKVGHDVFDYEPVFNYVKCTLLRRAHPGGKSPVVSHLDVLFILGTTVVTIVVNLNIAVASFTVAFYVARLLKINVPDMPAADKVKEMNENEDARKALA